MAIGFDVEHFNEYDNCKHSFCVEFLCFVDKLIEILLFVRSQSANRTIYFVSDLLAKLWSSLFPYDAFYQPLFSISCPLYTFFIVSINFLSSVRFSCLVQRLKMSCAGQTVKIYSYSSTGVEKNRKLFH